MAHPRMLFFVCCAAFAVLGVTDIAVAQDRMAPATKSPALAAEPSVSSALERHGIVHRGRRKAIDLASCIGLHRYGVRVVLFSERFHRFRCRLWATDGRRYVAWVQVTRSSASAFWWIAYRTRAVDIGRRL